MTALRVLILEDSPADAELMVEELRRHGFEPDWARVDTEAGYVARLGEGWDVILADYYLPGFDGMAALVLMRNRGLDIPFILVSGSLGEETAVKCLQSGAADYLSKDRLGRLGPAVERALAAKRLEADLRQAQKMEAVGRLAGGIAHDFNNLLTVITGRTEIALQRLGDPEAARRDLELVRKTAERAAALTKQLLAFSRRQALELQVLDPNAVVSGLLSLLRRLIGEDIELVTALDPGAGRVRADANQLEQVILNLAVNARDAMPRGGVLAITTTNADPDDGAAAPCVLLAVSDNGVGMDRETRSRIFEPFFTTKEKGKGTGLGLATAYGIVKQHDGTITVESAPGEGTTFRVYLPKVEEPVESGDRAAAPGRDPGGSETLLLVEDEEPVRRIALEILQASGYQVLEARDPADALRIAERHAGPIHLLLTDVVMPHMSGPELTGRIAMLRPGIRVLYMSGYTGEALGRHGDVEPGAALLQKPFTPDILGRKVRETLDDDR
ncbi:MAG: hypothetical protein A2X52_13690 [Candidatus Rokubacteria bacterium GWC2_70_16]|nr:MAG: hypothetical protein A2X52_13690 [Candidatus Rokubacteria bacterium GWC2_70_16]